jgi:hypothetical protein
MHQGKGGQPYIPHACRQPHCMLTASMQPQSATEYRGPLMSTKLKLDAQIQHTGGARRKQKRLFGGT